MINVNLEVHQIYDSIPVRATQKLNVVLLIVKIPI